MNLFPCIFLFLAAVATEGVPFEQNLRDAVAMKFMLQQHKVIFSISNRPQPSKDSSHYHRYQLVDDPSPVLASSPLVIGAYFNWTDLYVPVNVGTPAQHFTLLTYFFSGDSWLLDATAAVPPEDQFGNKKQIYLPSKSSSYKNESDGFIFDAFPFGTGDQVLSDLVNTAAAGVAVTEGSSASSTAEATSFRLKLGLVDHLNWMSTHILYNEPIDGFLGFVPQDRTTNNVSSFLTAVSEQLQLPAIVSIWIQPKLPRQYQRREASIAIGGVDRAHCDHRGWQWTESRGLWTLMVESIAINSTAAIAVREMAILLPSVVSIGPSGKIAELARLLGAVLVSGEGYVIDCAAAAIPEPLTLTMTDGVRLQFRRSDIITMADDNKCHLAFLGSDDPLWLLGTHLLNSYCYGLDYSSTSSQRMGFGPLKSSNDENI